MLKPISELKSRAGTIPSGVNLAYIRKRRGVTRRMLAHDAGVSVIYIRMIEQGRRRLTLKRAREFSEILECDFDDLLVPAKR